jgi:hypothetical protein
MVIASRSRLSLMLDARLEREDVLGLENRNVNELQKSHHSRPGEGGKKERRMKDGLSLNNFSSWNRKRWQQKCASFT